MGAFLDLYLHRVQERIYRRIDAECAAMIANPVRGERWAPVCEPAKPARRYELVPFTVTKAELDAL